MEALGQDRFDAITQLDNTACVAITDWRAATLKAHAYDGSLARIALPADATLEWVKSVADPATDLRHPMKGPFKSLRDGSADIHRAGIALAKSAQLLPAVVVVSGPHVTLGLTEVGIDVPDRASIDDVVRARLPLEVSEAGCLHVFRPDDGGKSTTPSRSARLTRTCPRTPAFGLLYRRCSGIPQMRRGPQLRAALAHG